MRRGYRLPFFLALIGQINGFVLEDDHCNYLYSDNCLTRPKNVPKSMNLCSREEVSDSVNFVLMVNESRVPPVILRVDFAPPKRLCKYGITLLANESIKSESECKNHKFNDSINIDAETHTGQMTVCNVPVRGEDFPGASGDVNANAAVDVGVDVDVEVEASPPNLCQKNIALRYQYIFTGCYAILFHLAENQDIIRGNVFLETNYKRTEVLEPNFTCKYGILPNGESESKKTLFVTEISALADTEVLLQLVSDSNNNGGEACGWYNQSIMYNWTVNVEQNTSDNLNCSINLTQAQDGKFIRRAECRFPAIVPEAASYCFVIRLNDERCKRQTLWNPPMANNIPCTWMKRCARMQKDNNAADMGAEIQAPTWMDSNTLLLPAVIIVAITFTIFGMIYLVHYWRTRNERVALYMHAKTVQTVRTNGEVSAKSNHDKMKDCDEGFFNRNIVLLYAKNTDSFMALMADFRGILARICQCTVHDWYDGSVWNYVAKVGGPEWFAEMLENGCRVIWMDTPVLRSLVRSKFRKGFTSKQANRHDYIEIGDFRDVLFPALFNFAKRDAQKSQLHHHPKHFIVRLRGFDNFEDEEGDDEDDPFTELSSCTRYLMPQDLGQLCSHLNATDLNMSVEDTRLEEDFIRQRLIHVEFESCK